MSSFFERELEGDKRSVAAGGDIIHTTSSAGEGGWLALSGALETRRELSARLAPSPRSPPRHLRHFLRRTAGPKS